MALSMQKLPPSLVSLLTSHLPPLAPRLGALPSLPAQAPLRLRRYASTTAAEDKTKARAKLQMRLTEKAGRMKSHIGVMTALPAFANYVRPADLAKRVPKDVKPQMYWRYYWADFRSWVYDKVLMSRFQNGFASKASLGPAWKAHFLERSQRAYTRVNDAFATGNYQKLERIATHPLVDSIKAKRLRAFPGLQLSWKLHGPIQQQIVCVRQQEMQKKGEFVAQVAVRFTSKQSLEVRNAKGELVGKGRKEEPETVVEYYVFQREMWKRDEDWQIMQSVREVPDPLNQEGVPLHEQAQLV